MPGRAGIRHIKTMWIGVGMVLLLFSLGAVYSGNNKGDTEGFSAAFAGWISQKLKSEALSAFLPILSFAEEGGESGLAYLVKEQTGCLFPLYQYALKTADGGGEQETVREILMSEAEEHALATEEDGWLTLLQEENAAAAANPEDQMSADETGAGDNGDKTGTVEGEGSGTEEKETGTNSGVGEEEGTGTNDGGSDGNGTGINGGDSDGDSTGGSNGENEEDDGEEEGSVTEFIPRSEKQAVVDLETLTDFDDLVSAFYTIDSSTMIDSDQLNVSTLTGKDMTVSTQEEGPQILIYHTHSQEAFADSVEGDRATSIVGVGDYLAEILTTQYGYQVLHHDGVYDLPSRDDAYSEALPAIAEILEENPQIQVVIDLHRDAVDEDTHLVVDIDGKPTARFMFFNGLSRTRSTGDISYLYNPYLEDNLAFSFQLEKVAMEYYPGLTRKIYLKAYRYNMHLCSKSLLVELGAQTNTVEEAMNACGPLAHILHLVLSGAE